MRLLSRSLCWFPCGNQSCCQIQSGCCSCFFVNDSWLLLLLPAPVVAPVYDTVGYCRFCYGWFIISTGAANTSWLFPPNTTNCAVVLLSQTTALSPTWLSWLLSAPVAVDILCSCHFLLPFCQCQLLFFHGLLLSPPVAVFSLVLGCYCSCCHQMIICCHSQCCSLCRHHHHCLKLQRCFIWL